LALSNTLHFSAGLCSVNEPSPWPPQKTPLSFSLLAIRSSLRSSFFPVIEISVYSVSPAREGALLSCVFWSRHNALVKTHSPSNYSSYHFYGGLICGRFFFSPDLARKKSDLSVFLIDRILSLLFSSSLFIVLLVFSPPKFRDGNFFLTLPSRSQCRNEISS